MAAITCLANPLNPQKVLIFSSGKKNILVLENREWAGKFGQVVGRQDGTVIGPKIAYPSTLTSYIQNDIIQVYGCSSSTVEGGVVYGLNIYSPISQNIDLEDEVKLANPLISGHAISNERQYLYFHGKKESTANIYQMEIADSGSGCTPLGIKEYHAQSKLRAVYDGKSRWLVYQKVDKFIAIWNCETSIESVVKESKNTAREKTHIGACLVPGERDKPARLFIYYTSEENKLYRAWAEIPSSGGALSFDQTANKPNNFIEDQTIDPGAQLSVVYNSEAKHNRLYCVKSGGGEKISYLVDDINKA